MKNYQKGSVGIIVAIIVAVLVIGGGAYYFSTKTTKAPISEIVSKSSAADQALREYHYGGKQIPASLDNIDDWKIYKNEEYGFEFKYPPNVDFYLGPKNNDLGTPFYAYMNIGTREPIQAFLADGAFPIDNTNNCKVFVSEDKVNELGTPFHIKEADQCAKGDLGINERQIGDGPIYVAIFTLKNKQQVLISYSAYEGYTANPREKRVMDVAKRVVDSFIITK